MSGTCKHGSEPLVFIKYGEFREHGSEPSVFIKYGEFRD